VTVADRCDDCGVTVITGASRRILPVEFVPLPVPRYDPSRVAGGAIAAVALLLVAWRLVASTNWRPPAEAAVPDVDEP